jgi:hypothetical protein
MCEGHVCCGGWVGVEVEIKGQERERAADGEGGWKEGESLSCAT